MIKRITKQRPEKKPIIILVDGFTEKNYFESFKSYIHNTNPYKNLHIINANTSINIQHEKHKNFNKLYEKANNYKDNNETIYIVFDRENELKRSKTSISKLIKKGNKNGFISIISNQSFDFRILLHLQKFEKQITNLSEYYKLLSKELNYKDYENEAKNDKNLFNKIKNSIETAISRAKELEDKYKNMGVTDEDIYFKEPYTSVYKIIETIKSISNPKN